MALRFRRSIKLGKGLRMNVSKRGVGMSLGTKGLRSSIHSTGSRTNTIGIPGTGLSYVNRAHKKKKGKPKKQSNATNYQIPTTENQAVVEQYQNYIDDIKHLHQHSPQQTTWMEIKDTPAPFSPDETGPRQKAALQRCHAYSPTFLERLFTKFADNKRKKLKDNVHKAEQQDKKQYQHWKEQNVFATSVLEGNPAAYEQVIQRNDNFDKMRDRIQMRVVDPITVEMNVKVAPNDIIPQKKVTLTKTGRVSKRKMGKKEYFEIVQSFVCGHAMWTARCLFASLPVGVCVIHMTETALNKATGHEEEHVLLSVQFDRQTMDQLNFALLNPYDAMENFTYRMDFLKTKGFRPVERLLV